MFSLIINLGGHGSHKKRSDDLVFGLSDLLYIAQDTRHIPVPKEFNLIIIRICAYTSSKRRRGCHGGQKCID